MFAGNELVNKGYVMVYSDRQLVAIQCQVEPGGFSGERLFTVQLANGEDYVSVAPRQFCWNSNGNLVAINEPASKVNGLVAARVLEELEHSQVLVEVPDGQIIAVDRSKVQRRPTPIKPERKLDVPV
jgi:hypothetical protein